jgi:hypothetical protein
MPGTYPIITIILATFPFTSGLPSLAGGTWYLSQISRPLPSLLDVLNLLLLPLLDVGGFGAHALC